MLTPPTVAELATFTGRAISTFSSFAVEALSQATLLMYLATELASYPTDPELSKLTKYGIMDMADKIYLSQPYQEASASPYQSETIGSYSYSKAVAAVKKGNDTGVMWFDLAISKVSTGSAIGSTGSIQGMEFDGLGVSVATGRPKIVGGSGRAVDLDSSGAWAWSIDTLNNGPEVDTDHLF
jgi:hypothetical protein